MSTVFLIIILMTPFLVILGWFIVSTEKAFRKFDSLETGVREKLLLMEYYMVFVRSLSAEELVKIAELPDEEIKKFNDIHDWDERIKTAKEKIRVVFDKV